MELYITTKRKIEINDGQVASLLVATQHLQALYPNYVSRNEYI